MKSHCIIFLTIMYTLVGAQAIVHKEKKRYFKQLRGKMLGGG